MARMSRNITSTSTARRPTPTRSISTSTRRRPILTSTWWRRTVGVPGTSLSTNCSTPASFKDDRYFDVFVEYAKDGPEDILVRITAVNRGPDAAELHLLPTLWFRNDWSTWIAESNRAATKPT